MTTKLKSLAAELQNEATSTRKFFPLLPEDKYDWKPHEKSMTLIQLATHIAEMPGWVDLALNTSEMDFAVNQYQPTIVKNNEELQRFFEDTLQSATEKLEAASDEVLDDSWTMRNGEKIYFTMPKEAVLRSCVLSHVTHHRAQLGVYLRLLDISVPGCYGPSADEMAEFY